jgi:hypothetical protein
MAAGTKIALFSLQLQLPIFSLRPASGRKSFPETAFKGRLHLSKCGIPLTMIFSPQESIHVASGLQQVQEQKTHNVDLWEFAFESRALNTSIEKTKEADDRSTRHNAQLAAFSPTEYQVLQLGKILPCGFRSVEASFEGGPCQSLSDSKTTPLRGDM